MAFIALLDQLDSRLFLAVCQIFLFVYVLRLALVGCVGCGGNNLSRLNQVKPLLLAHSFSFLVCLLFCLTCQDALRRIWRSSAKRQVDAQESPASLVASWEAVEGVAWRGGRIDRLSWGAATLTDRQLGGRFWQTRARQTAARLVASWFARWMGLASARVPSCSCCSPRRSLVHGRFGDWAVGRWSAVVGVFHGADSR